MERKWKFRSLVILSALYIISFLLMTIGYFTPSWAVYVKYTDYYRSFYYPGYYSDIIHCDTVGLVSGWCRYGYGNMLTNGVPFGRVMLNVFWIETAALVFLYVNSTLLVVGIVLGLLEDQVYQAFLSVSLGVLYPVSAFLALTGSIYIEAYQGDKTGFSCILCTIAGWLMTVVYVGLRIYDKLYLLSRKNGRYRSSTNGSRKQQTSKQVDSLDTSYEKVPLKQHTYAM